MSIDPTLLAPYWSTKSETTSPCLCLTASANASQNTTCHQPLHVQFHNRLVSICRTYVYCPSGPSHQYWLYLRVADCKHLRVLQMLQCGVGIDDHSRILHPAPLSPACTHHTCRSQKRGSAETRRRDLGAARKQESTRRSAKVE